jgi:hypothetical protein
MANLSSTIRPLAQVEAAATPTIYNVAIALANTEVSQALSSGTKSFTIRVRGSSSLQLAFTSGQSGTNYITLRPGVNYTQEGLNFNGTLYFQSPAAAQTVEILEWS